MHSKTTGRILFVMARPRRSEHNREAILAEGITLLSEQGYNGTGLKEILDTVKVPKGSFYNYFESKEAFAAEIIEHYMDRLLTIFDNFIAHSTADPVTLIRQVYLLMVQEFKRMHCQQGCLIGNLAAEIGGKSDICQRAMLNALGQWESRFVPLLEQGQEQGLIRKDIPAKTLTNVFWCAWEGSILRMKVSGNTELMEELLETMLGGLFKPG